MPTLTTALFAVFALSYNVAHAANCDAAALREGLDALDEVGSAGRVDAALNIVVDACTDLPPPIMQFRDASHAERQALDVAVMASMPSLWSRICVGDPRSTRASDERSTDRDGFWDTCELRKRTAWTTRAEWVNADGPVFLPFVVNELLLEGTPTDDGLIRMLVATRLARALAGLPDGIARDVGKVYTASGDPDLDPGVCRLTVGLDTGGDQGLRLIPIETGVVVSVSNRESSNNVVALSCDNAALGNLGPSGDDVFCDDQWYAIDPSSAQWFEPAIPAVQPEQMLLKGCRALVR